jgi:trk system potassium uptake protein TrkH
MFLRPDGRDLGIIGYHLGRIATGLALLMALPALLALTLREWNSATALLAGAGVAASVGQLTEWRLQTRAPLTWAHGTVVVAVAWLLGPLLAAVPLFLSGHLGTFLDAWFEAMSGLTTSGLSVVQDLDHLSYSLNLYRHLTHFAGGQGIVIVALSLFAARSGIPTLYAAEGREERVLPNVVRTARFIFLVAGVHLVVGTLALVAATHVAGIGGWRGLWHAVNLFFAAFDTGGFAPASPSVAYYHSSAVEAVLLVLMVSGTMSFALHHRLWSGRWREVGRDLEVRSLVATMSVTVMVALVGLVLAGTHARAGGLFRRGFFTVVSAHSGTGFGVVDGARYLTDWGALAPAAVVVAMALGGMAGSTAGGIKALRVGLVAKGVVQDVRRILLPRSAVAVARYHTGRDHLLTGRTVRAAATILLLYVLTYLAGALVALAYGRWGITETLFESVSAAANVGLSVGIAEPGMPAALQVVYVLQMWLGRLEFLAAFAFVGYAVSLVRGRT